MVSSETHPPLPWLSASLLCIDWVVEGYDVLMCVWQEGVGEGDLDSGRGAFVRGEPGRAGKNIKILKIKTKKASIHGARARSPRAGRVARVYSTVQHGTVHSTVQYSTVQYGQAALPDLQSDCRATVGLVPSDFTVQPGS